jgi:hypothetical protein
MIDKLEQRINALNSAYDDTETSSEYNPNYLGSLVGDFRPTDSFEKSEKTGDASVKLGTTPEADIEWPHYEVSIPQKELKEQRDVLYAYHFKEMEVDALRNYGDRSSITNINALGAVCRLLSWMEVYEKDEGRREKGLAFLKKTRMMMEKLEAMKKEGWRIDDDDFNAIGERLDDILEYDFTVYA